MHDARAALLCWLSAMLLCSNVSLQGSERGLPQRKQFTAESDREVPSTASRNAMLYNTERHGAPQADFSAWKTNAVSHKPEMTRTGSPESGRPIIGRSTCTSRAFWQHMFNATPFTPHQYKHTRIPSSCEETRTHTMNLSSIRLCYGVAKPWKEQSDWLTS